MSKLNRRTTLGGLLALGAAAACRAPAKPDPHREGRAADASGAADRSAPPAALVRVIQAEDKIEGDGATVRRLFPTRQLPNLDPFVLLDDFDVRQPAGFPMHPHRGFEAFTYMIDGAFHHRDTMGNDSVIGPGGTQRFTSGRGARHSEMPATAGSNRGLQLWVNLPQRLKKIDPTYAGVDGSAMPIVREAGATLREIVGELSPVELQTEVRYHDLELEPGCEFSAVIPEGHNALLYVMNGELRAFDQSFSRGAGLLPSAGRIDVRTEAGARFVLLSGRPHGEPIRHRGPFVD